MPPKPKSTKRKGKQKEKGVDQPQPEETVDVSIEELLEDVVVSKFASVHNVTDFTKSLRQPGDVAKEEPNADEPENTGAGEGKAVKSEMRAANQHKNETSVE